MQHPHYRHAFLMTVLLASAALYFPGALTAQFDVPGGGATPHPNQNQNVLAAKDAYEAAKELTKETKKTVTLERLKLQKLIKGGGDKAATGKTAASKTPASKASSPLLEAQKAYSNKVNDLNLLKRQLIAKLKDPKLERLQKEVLAIEAKQRQSQSTATPGEINRQFIELSQQLNRVRKELNQYESELLKKDKQYTTLAQEVDEFKAMLFTLRRELAMQRKSGGKTPGAAGKSTTPMSPEVEAQKKIVDEAVAAYAEASKAQKQAQKDLELAYARAQQAYALYLKKKKQEEIDRAVEEARAAREARRNRTNNRRDRR